MCWLPPPDGRTLAFIDARSSHKRPAIAEANTKAFKAGYNYGATSEDLRRLLTRSHPRSSRPAGTGRCTGNTAIAYGLIAASRAIEAAALPSGRHSITRPRRSSRKPRPVTRASAWPLSRRRTRSLPAAQRSAPSGRRSRRLHLGRPGHRLSKAEMVGLGIMPRAAAPDPRHPTRAGPFDGHARPSPSKDLLMALFGPTANRWVP